MPTNDAPSDAARIDAFRASLRGPVGLSIAGASAYWLETPARETLGPESPTSSEPLERARREICASRDPRRLVLTTPAFFEIFKRATVGAVASGIDVVCLPLPTEIQAEVDRVAAVASLEVSPGR